jgi:hypothetical protein
MSAALLSAKSPNVSKLEIFEYVEISEIRSPSHAIAPPQDALNERNEHTPTKTEKLDAMAPPGEVKELRFSKTQFVK